MTDYAISEMIGPGGDTWNLPSGERRRQAIASLRGYAYQLHRTVAEWLVLEDREFLFIEAAEDYALIGRDPERLEEILNATQVKDTRQSGSVTLNSEDVRAAIVNFWRLKHANPGRRVSLTFLTTSPIGTEKKDPLPSRLAGLTAWQAVARGDLGLIAELRDVLKSRIGEPASLVDFLQTADDTAFLAELVQRITWSCGEPDYADIVTQNREDLIALGVSMQGSAEQSERALDTLLHTVLNTIVNDAQRRLTRGSLLKIVEDANTVRVPIARATTSGIDLDATGSWVGSEAILPARLARRPDAIKELNRAFDERRRLWLHGPNGMGKSTLAALFGLQRSGRWQALRLRGLAGAAVSERLIAARQALARMTGVIGLIIDDLPVAQESQYLVALQALGALMTREGLCCVVTANHRPGSALQQALGLAELDIVDAPEFTEDDAAHLVASFDGNPATWAKFVRLAGGFGHPQLVHAVVAGIAARGWQTREMTTWLNHGFRSDDVVNERAAVRQRLIDELGADKAGLLSRLSRVKGSFDRKVIDDLAQIAPPAANARVTAETFAGTWLERLGNDRLRASPLIADLADHLSASDQIKDMDRAIGRSIILRETLEGDLLDTGFVHALLAKDDGTIARLCMAILQGPYSAMLASAMPVFRDYQPDITMASSHFNPTMKLFLAIARHRLLVTRRDKSEINGSVRYILELVDTGEAPPSEELSHSSFITALTTILGLEESMGLVDGWFALLRQLDEARGTSQTFQNIHANASRSMGIAPNDFLFAAHSLHLPSIAALQSLFDELEGLPVDQRRRWLAALKHDTGWLGMTIANAWLKDADAKRFDWSTGADRYAAMAEQALGWDEPHIAARCFVAQSVLLDEYGNDPVAALNALDAAEKRLPRSLDLVRERAKISWRMGDFEQAYQGLSSIEQWLEEGDAIEASFAFREAAMSAGELGRYRESERYFLMAHGAASRVKTDQEAFKLGLRIDAVGVRYMSGDRLGAIRILAPILEELVRLDSEKSLQNRAVTLLGRHFVLWLRSQLDPSIMVDDRPPHYFVGAISNPSPHRGLLEMPTPKKQAPLWFLLGLVALEEGIGFDELSQWPGIVDLSRHADLYVQLPLKRLELAVENLDISEVSASLPEAITAMAYFAQARAAMPEIDPLDPVEAEMGVFGETDAGALAARDLGRDAIIAYALHSFLASGHADFEQIPRAANLLAEDFVPEWSGSEATDMRGAAAAAVFDLSGVQARTLPQEFKLQLQLWDWLRFTIFRPSSMPQLCEYVRRFWSDAVRNRRFEMSLPNITEPEIERVLAEFAPTNKWLATMLLATRHATRVQLSAEFVDLLKNAK